MTYCPLCTHPSHELGRCHTCWAPPNLASVVVDVCCAALNRQSRQEEERLRRLHDPVDIEGRPRADTMLRYRLHEWDPGGLKERPTRFVCLHCGLGIDMIQVAGIQCIEGRPTEPPSETQAMT